jgi:hypothetical protein
MPRRFLTIVTLLGLCVATRGGEKTLGDLVATFAEGNKGKKVGDGECTTLARIMHSRGQGRRWDECKRLGQPHLRAFLILKGWMQSARPGRPGASVA